MAWLSSQQCVYEDVADGLGGAVGGGVGPLRRAVVGVGWLVGLQLPSHHPLPHELRPLVEVILLTLVALHPEPHAQVASDHEDVATRDTPPA